MAKKNVYKSPDVKKEEADKKSVATLTTRLSVAKKTDEKMMKQWKQVLKVLDFERDVIVGGDTSSVKIKYPLLWSAYDNYLSNLVSSPPQIMIEADGKEDIIKKIFWKGVLQHKKRVLHVDDLREQFVDSFISTGKAVMKVGRVVETEKTKQVVKAVEGQPSLEQEIEAITKNETFIENIDPRKVWISSETKYQGPILGEECPYIIEEMLKTPEYLKATYDITVDDDECEYIDFENEFNEGGKVSNKVDYEDKDDMKRVRVYLYYGVWEIKGKTDPNAEVLFTKKRVIRARTNPYAHGKKPYIYALNFKKFFKPTANGSLYPVLDLDQEYNEHMNRLRTILRRLANPKWAKTQGTQVDESALLDPDVGLLVEESQPNSFRAVEGPKTDPALFDKATSVEQLFQLLTGIVYGATAIKEAGTATGQGIVEKGADVKLNRMTQILERAYEERDIMMLQLEQQFAGEEGTDIRITGADLVQLLRNKKELFTIQQQMFEDQQMALQTGQAHEMNGYVMSGPEHNPESQVMGKLTDTPPVDEYDKFQISSDGKSILTNYTAEDIKGEFELTVISQSSNRSNKAVQAQQTINALTETRPGEETLRKELWRRLFSIYNWDELLDVVDQIAQMPLQPPMGQEGPQGTGINETAINSSVNAQAQRTT